MKDHRLADSGDFVQIFREGEDLPEEMALGEYVDEYGEEALFELRERRESKLADWQPGMVLRPDIIPAPQPDDMKSYYEAFRKLAGVCGEYEQKRKMLGNALDGVLTVQKVTYEYFHKKGKHTNAVDNLVDRIQELEKLKKAALTTLDYWSKRVGFKRMSTPEDVKKYHLNGRADTEILLDYLQYEDFRKRLRYRIDKYNKKVELKSITELVVDVFDSYKDNPS